MTAGTCLGPYEILEPIGAGGMGEVYRARDTRLGRTGAIKVCAERFSDRFHRKARSIAALNHPNICTLHDIGESADRDFLVMEYVEGQTLREMIAGRPIPVAGVIEYDPYGRRTRRGARERNRPSRSKAGERHDHAARASEDYK
jgi:eukaryotic-like serine/threonine-protein kinase